MARAVLLGIAKVVTRHAPYLTIGLRRTLKNAPLTQSVEPVEKVPDATE